MKTARRQPVPKRCRGISLVETVLSLAILAGAFAAALNNIASARGAQAVITQRQYGLVLAEDLMAEILSKSKYKEGLGLGPETDELLFSNRSAFDDMDDYRNWSSSPPVDPDGFVIEGADGYSRAVQVEYVNVNDLSLDSLTDQGVVRITVTVNYGSKVVASLIAYRTDAWQDPMEAH